MYIFVLVIDFFCVNKYVNKTIEYIHFKLLLYIILVKFIFRYGYK
jgi:hypothetical protein